MPQTFTQTFADGSHVNFNGPGFGPGHTPTPQQQQSAAPASTGPQLGYNPNGAQWSIGWSIGKGVAVCALAIAGFIASWAISGQWATVAECETACKEIRTEKILAEKDVRLREIAASEKISGDNAEARKVEATHRTPVIAAPAAPAAPAVIYPQLAAARPVVTLPPTGGAPTAGSVLPRGMVPGEWTATGNSRTVRHGERIDTKPRPCVRFGGVQGECGWKKR